MSKKQPQTTDLQLIPNFVIFQTSTGKVNIEVFFKDKTLWLSQKKMAELFEVKVPAISKHLKNIFESGELDEKVVVSILESTTQHGAIKSKTQTKKNKFYNLHAILSVGYRVNSQRAIEFRKWANEVLEEYIIKGFTMDDERLKQMKHFGKDYFDEQLERIRDVRSSERRLYQKITDIYAQCSADYDPNILISKEFFATVQNKLHWAIVGETAAEIIYNRVDSNKQNMGLTNWKNSPNGKIRRDDVAVAKNYLSYEELDFFNRIVTMYLDYAELQAKNKKVMYMKDWIAKLNVFLQFNEKEVLEHKGKISHKVAIALAYSEYEKYRVIQDREYISDFDRLLLDMENEND